MATRTYPVVSKRATRELDSLLESDLCPDRFSKEGLGRARIRKQITELQKQHADTCRSNASKYQLTIKYAGICCYLCTS